MTPAERARELIDFIVPDDKEAVFWHDRFSCYLFIEATIQQAVEAERESIIGVLSKFHESVGIVYGFQGPYEAILNALHELVLAIRARGAKTEDES